MTAAPQERATAAEELLREQHAAAQGAWFAAAAERLAVATRSWHTFPPNTRAQLDSVAGLVEALRRGLIEMRAQQK